MAIIKEQIPIHKKWLWIKSNIPFKIENNYNDSIEKAPGTWRINTWELLPEQYHKNNPVFMLYISYDNAPEGVVNPFCTYSLTDIELSAIDSGDDSFKPSDLNETNTLIDDVKESVVDVKNEIANKTVFSVSDLQETDSKIDDVKNAITNKTVFSASDLSATNTKIDDVKNAITNKTVFSASDLTTTNTKIDNVIAAINNKNVGFNKKNDRYILVRSELDDGSFQSLRSNYIAIDSYITTHKAIFCAGIQQFLVNNFNVATNDITNIFNLNVKSFIFNNGTKFILYDDNNKIYKNNNTTKNINYILLDIKKCSDNSTNCIVNINISFDDSTLETIELFTNYSNIKKLIFTI